jgi:aminopeptidase-like protein
MTADVGTRLHAFAAQLYPICRSITGDGVRATLQLIRKHMPLEVREVPSGSQVFDWEVPLEWNIEDAYVKDSDGRKVVDFRDHNLHLVSYSEPLERQLTLAELRPNLHTHKHNPDWIPYRTSYYRRSWGFCLRGRESDRLREGKYEVRVDSSLEKGSLTYGEFVLPGRSREEVLFFTHVCHPSLANDNTSGMAIATWLADWLAQQPRRYTYRFVFAPGTIGSLCWLKRNEHRLARIRHGLVLGLLGDGAPLTYKRSRRGNAEIDRIAEYALRSLEPQARAIPFEPYGYDERQLCSPGFDLPVGRLTRSVNDGYAEYHSSADDLSLITPAQLEASLLACQRICEVIEADRRYINLSPKGEARLGKRGLYGATGGNSPAAREHAMLWMLNQSDGSQSVLDIAQTSDRPFDVLAGAALELEKAGLMRAVANAEVGQREFRKVVSKKSKARPKAGKRRKK